MRIAQVSTLSAPVGQVTEGSIESHVWLLSRELMRLGHEVTVFGLPGSDTKAELVTPLPGSYGENGAPDDWELCEWINLCEAVKQSKRFDVLHAHAYLWGLPLEPLSSAPMVHTMHIMPEDDSVKLWSRSPNACVTALSHSQWSEHPHLHPAAVVPHGFDASTFTLRLQAEDYVCYLGRFIPSKGPREAVEAARALGLRLRIAGPSNKYFEEQIKPHVDGKSVAYLGFVRGHERDQLLGGARALLFPVQWQEPFGLVLVEAMLCGTPVVAMRRGAVPEIVDQGITGYYADTWEEFLQLVPKAMALDRANVREQAMKRFSAAQMTRDFLRVYEAVVASKDRA